MVIAAIREIAGSRKPSAHRFGCRTFALSRGRVRVSLMLAIPAGGGAQCSIAGDLYGREAFEDSPLLFEPDHRVADSLPSGIRACRRLRPRFAIFGIDKPRDRGDFSVLLVDLLEGEVVDLL